MPSAGLGGLAQSFGSLPFGQEHAYTAQIQASQMVYSGGRLGAARKIATGFERAARYNLGTPGRDALHGREHYDPRALGSDTGGRGHARSRGSDRGVHARRVSGPLFATGRIITETEDSALVVPLSAIRNEGNQSFVWLLENDVIVKGTVELGTRSDTPSPKTSLSSWTTSPECMPIATALWNTDKVASP